jgi:very-short-patch-repair endonuclease
MDCFDLIHRSLNNEPLGFLSKEESRKLTSFTKKRRWAESMKRKPTKAEAAMWDILRHYNRLKFKLRRQYVLFGYIADFAFIKAKFIVEVDGSSHDKRGDHDRTRDRVFRAHKWKTLRFTNEQAFANDPLIIKTIEELLSKRGRRRNRLRGRDSMQRVFDKQKAIADFMANNQVKRYNEKGELIPDEPPF